MEPKPAPRPRLATAGPCNMWQSVLMVNPVDAGPLDYMCDFQSLWASNYVMKSKAGERQLVVILPPSPVPRGGRSSSSEWRPRDLSPARPQTTPPRPVAPLGGAWATTSIPGGPHPHWRGEWRQAWRWAAGRVPSPPPQVWWHTWLSGLAADPRHSHSQRGWAGEASRVATPRNSRRLNVKLSQ